MKAEDENARSVRFLPRPAHWFPCPLRAELEKGIYLFIAFSVKFWYDRQRNVTNAGQALSYRAEKPDAVRAGTQARQEAVQIRQKPARR